MDNFDGQFVYVANEDNVFTFRTNLNSPRYRYLNLAALAQLCLQQHEGSTVLLSGCGMYLVWLDWEYDSSLRLFAIRRLVRTDISSTGSVSGHPNWEDVIPQHASDLMQWATALKVNQQIFETICAAAQDIEQADNAFLAKA